MPDAKDHTKDLPKIWGGSKFNEKGGSILLDNLHLLQLSWVEHSQEVKTTNRGNAEAPISKGSIAAIYLLF